jgi:DNA helicase-2/ATP-dependent DNA helicase PcrA
MGSRIITLSDSHETIDIEHPFKDNAGPGAGKTTWIINHIRNVIQRSNRLGQVKKIACITYTNVAAKKILFNLGEACKRVEIGTIHAFLYKHVVKPYVSFLGILELSVDRIKGHDEYVPKRLILYGVKEETKQIYLDDKNLLETLLDLQ